MINTNPKKEKQRKLFFFFCGELPLSGWPGRFDLMKGTIYIIMEIKQILVGNILLPETV